MFHGVNVSRRFVQTKPAVSRGSSHILIGVLAVALIVLGVALFRILFGPVPQGTNEHARRRHAGVGATNDMSANTPPTATTRTAKQVAPSSIGSPQAAAAEAQTGIKTATGNDKFLPGSVESAASAPATAPLLTLAPDNSVALGCPYEPITLEQKERLEHAFHGQKLKVELGFFGDASTSALASQLAYVLALDEIDAKVYGGGRIDSPTERGVELYVRNHLHPSQKDAAVLKRFAASGIPFATFEMPKSEDKSVDLFIFVAPKAGRCPP